jgi:signal transduction histidine kinase
MKIVDSFARQPRAWILAEMMGALLIIGLFDFFTSYELRLLPLYAGPIFVVAWFFEKKMGLVAAAISAVIWWCANWFNGDPDLHSWVRTWEIIRHVAFFAVVALTGGALRAKSDYAVGRIALLEHSRRLENEIVNISEAEQRRIGRDLHDGVCQVLAALSCSATLLRGELEKRNLPAEARKAGELASLLQNAVVETRDLARSLVPAHVSDVGLTLALEALAQSVSRWHSVNCSFHFGGGEVAQDEQVATHLYRIAQEAISNAINHGKAKNVGLYLAAVGDRVTLQITDDGIGIPDAPSRKGMGLAVMQYRARLSGGELTIERTEKGGTRICCSAQIVQSPNENSAAA